MSKPIASRKRRPIVLALLSVALAIAALWRLGQDLKHAQRREATLTALQAQIKQNPRDGDLLALTAFREIQAHDYASAASHLETAARLGNADRALWLTWAATLAISDPDSAAGILELGQRDPKLARPLADALARFDALPENATGPDLAFAISPEGPDALGKRVAEPNYLSPVVSALSPTPGFATQEARAKAFPDDGKIQLAWAKALRENARFPDAERVILERLKKNARDFDAALALAETRLAAGQNARAMQVFRACANERPDSFDAQLGLARVAIDQKLVYLGMEAAQKATRLDPKSAAAWQALGTAYFNQKMRWDKACDAFAKARALEPDNLDGYGPEFDSLRLAGRGADAEALIRKRLAQDPEDARAHYLLAAILLDARGDAATAAEAEHALRESLRLYPDSATAQMRLGQLLLERGESQEAVTRFEKTLDLTPYNPQALALLARAYRRTGRAADAKTAEGSARLMHEYVQELTPLEDARARDPMDLTARKKLARLYRIGGELDKARAEDETIFMLEKYPEQAARGLSSLAAETALVAATDWPAFRKKTVRVPLPNALK